MAVCVPNLPLVILLMLSPLRNKVKTKIKSNQDSSVNSRVISYISSIWINKYVYKIGFLNFLTNIYEVCIDICIIYVLQDSCNLDVNRRVGDRVVYNALWWEIVSTPSSDIHVIIRHLWKSDIIKLVLFCHIKEYTIHVVCTRYYAMHTALYWTPVNTGRYNFGII